MSARTYVRRVFWQRLFAISSLRYMHKTEVRKFVDRECLIELLDHLIKQYCCIHIKILDQVQSKAVRAVIEGARVGTVGCRSGYRQIRAPKIHKSRLRNIASDFVMLQLRNWTDALEIKGKKGSSAFTLSAGRHRLPEYQHGMRAEKWRSDERAKAPAESTNYLGDSPSFILNYGYV